MIVMTFLNIEFPPRGSMAVRACLLPGLGGQVRFYPRVRELSQSASAGEPGRRGGFALDVRVAGRVKAPLDVAGEPSSSDAEPAVLDGHLAGTQAAAVPALVALPFVVDVSRALQPYAYADHPFRSALPGN